MTENLPPLPGTEEPPPSKPSLTAYILRGREWVEIGTATPHPDGKGHQLRFAISPVDGDTVELRTADAAHIGGGQEGPRVKRNRTSRPRPRA